MRKVCSSHGMLGSSLCVFSVFKHAHYLRHPNRTPKLSSQLLLIPTLGAFFVAAQQAVKKAEIVRQAHECPFQASFHTPAQLKCRKPQGLGDDSKNWLFGLLPLFVFFRPFLALHPIGHSLTETGIFSTCGPILLPDLQRCVDGSGT